MAERHEEQEHEEPASLAELAELTTVIVAAYVTRNPIAMADLGNLIDTVSRQLRGLGRKEPEQAAARPVPAVPVRRSIQEDHLVCLVCGRRQKTLRRHLAVAHQLTPAAYRELFDLGPEYPMTAPGYSRQRSEMARLFGLGSREQASPRRRRKAQT